MDSAPLHVLGQLLLVLHRHVQVQAMRESHEQHLMSLALVFAPLIMHHDPTRWKQCMKDRQVAEILIMHAPTLVAHLGLEVPITDFR